MNKIFNKYISFSAGDFALDDDFIDWVLSPNAASNAFWQAFLSANPQQAQNVEAAKTMIAAFQEDAVPALDKIRDEVWNNIRNENSKGKVRRLFPPKYRLVAACLTAVIAIGFLFFFINSTEKKEDFEALTSIGARDSIVPGSEKAFLTLSDGTIINLDSAHKGELSQQGTARLFVLPGGKLTYEQTTKSVVKTHERKNTVTTPRGGQYQLQLADGTRVWLNAASSITYPVSFTGTERRVTVTGEAYLEVAHDPHLPFYVNTGDLEVKVLGTRFNVNAYGDDGNITTTLLEGAVQAIKSGDKKNIKPGEQVVTRKGEDKLLVRQSVDASAVLSWKEGYFEFSHLPIAAILNQISRWYDVDVIRPDTIGNNAQFGGRISKNLPLNQLLQLLENSGIFFSVQGRKIVVTKVKTPS